MKRLYIMIIIALAQSAMISAADISEQDPSSSRSSTGDVPAASHPVLPDFITLPIPEIKTYGRGRSIPAKEEIDLKNKDYILHRSFKKLIKDAHKEGLPWIMVAYYWQSDSGPAKDYGDAHEFLNWHYDEAMNLIRPQHVMHNKQISSPTFYAVRITDNPDQPLAVINIGNELDLKNQDKLLIYYLSAKNPKLNIEQKNIAMTYLGYQLKEQGLLEQSKDWLELAAQKGDRTAMNNLGHLLYEQGLLEQAKHWFKQAAQKGNTDAKYNLGALLEEQGDLKQAKHWLEQAAKEGSTNAMSNLGSMLKNQGDLKQAEDLYKQAAKKGNIYAMNNLGRFYEDQGNIDDAIKWRKAAEAKGFIYSLIALLYLANTYADKFTQEELAEYIHKFLTLKAANHPDIQSYEQELPDRFQGALHVVNKYAAQEEPMEIKESSASIGTITESSESEDESDSQKRKRSEEESESSEPAQKRQATHIDLAEEEE